MKNEHYIYVTEMQNWTDTTSVIALQYSDNPLSEEVDSLQANIGVYKNHKVIYSVGSFEKTPKKSRMISNNIKWNNFSYDKNKSNSDNNSLKYSEYELQFVYDFVNDTIIRVLKSYPSKELNILEKIKKCQF